MEEKLKEIFNYGVKLEEDSISFYSESAEKTNNPLGKQIFDFLIGEEKKHIEILNKIMSDMVESEDIQALARSHKDVRTVFTDASQDYKSDIASDPDDIKALEISMELENKGFKYYKEEAEKMPEKSRGRSLLEELARQESSHYELLDKTIQYLKDPQNWYLTDEKGPVEGG
ncbi:MAG: ferritin family protein [Spirochaetes bacterium]|nr:ferritin family protein [Spirochaetota bacterium]